jgi:hypothetical protein
MLLQKAVVAVEAVVLLLVPRVTVRVRVRVTVPVPKKNLTNTRLQLCWRATNNTCPASTRPRVGM